MWKKLGKVGKGWEKVAKAGNSWKFVGIICQKSAKVASPIPDKQLVKIELLSCTLQKEHARGNISPAFASPVFIHDGG